MIRLPSRELVTAALIALAGCGQGYTPPSVPPRNIPGPHGATSYRLPEDRGYVELLNEPAVEPRSEEPTAIVAYFFQEGEEGASKVSASEVQFDIEQNREQKSVPLKPSSGGGEARFASEPGAYNLKTIRGTLRGKIDGQDFVVNISGDRR